MELAKNDLNSYDAVGDIYHKNTLKELRRRVDITYRTRIIATDRLRNKNQEYKRLNMYYSALVTGLSILSMGDDYKLFNKMSVSNIVLTLSILLTYFMFYNSEKNLQERAYKMEETFKKLDKLKNKIDITLTYELDLDEVKCKKLYQEYERVLISIENHEQIDFYMYKYNQYKNDGVKDSEKEMNKDIKRQIMLYKIKVIILTCLKYSIPTAIACVLFFSMLNK